jgi:hypothetical protein
MARCDGRKYLGFIATFVSRQFHVARQQLASVTSYLTTSDPVHLITRRKRSRKLSFRCLTIFLTSPDHLQNRVSRRSPTGNYCRLSHYVFFVICSRTAPPSDTTSTWNPPWIMYPEGGSATPLEGVSSSQYGRRTISTVTRHYTPYLLGMGKPNTSSIAFRENPCCRGSTCSLFIPSGRSERESH